METCEHKDKVCPISKTSCPGVCVYAEIMDNLYLGIIVLDVSQKTVVFQNRFTLDLFKDMEGEKDYKTLTGLLIPDMKEFLSRMPNTLRNELHFDDRILGYTAYHVTERFIWMFILDITEKARLESIAEAVNAMNNIGYIFSGLRHEIGNPINSIKMTLSVLRNNIEKYPREMVMDYVDRSLGEISRIEYLLKALKNFNMYENPDLREIEIPSFMEKFLSLVKNDFQQDGISIATNFSPKAEKAYTDPRALHQVLLNIMTNASDALKGREDPQIRINVKPSQGRILLSIVDNGRGMSEKQKENLFKPFMTSKPSGTGLGLVIAKKMLSRMAGTIDISSLEDFGTTVNIAIPENRTWNIKAQKRPSL